MEFIKKHWIAIVVAIIIIGVAIWYFFMRNTDTVTTTGYIQINPIDKGGCDANLKDVNGNPCTAYVAPVLKIVSATYQNNSGSKSKDVTSILQGYVSNGQINLTGVVMNDIFGGDVAVGEPKKLVVKYSVDGISKFIEIPETSSTILIK